MSQSRTAPSSSTLPDGRVLIAGGYAGSTTFNSVDLYDPASASFVPTTPMNTARNSHGAALLPGGRVLVLGGAGANFALYASAEIYDIATATWRNVGQMNSARRAPQLVTLPDGRILVIGSDVDDGYNTSEIFDPASETFGQVATIPFAIPERTTVPSREAMIGLLPNGKVLLAGGYTNGASSNNLSAAYLWNPDTNQWSATGSMSTPRYAASFSLLPNGKALLAGGHNGTGLTNSSELYDPDSGQFSVGPTLVKARSKHRSITLSDGTLLMLGGYTPSYLYETTIERYDAAGNTFSAIGSMVYGRTFFNLHRVAGDRVLSIGGGYEPTIVEFFDIACTVAPIQLSASSQSFGGNGGSGSVAVTAPAGCPWEVRSFSSWISITGGATGVGNGTVNYSVAASTVDYGRGATLQIGQTPYTINQAAPVCDPNALASLSAGNLFVGSAGASVAVNLTYAAACNWNVGTLPSWISASPASGKGSTSITFSIQRNATANNRTATVTVANASMTVRQDADCTLATPSISPLSQNFAASGGSGTVAVTQSASCSWSAVGVPSWVTINANSGGLGSATVYYTVAANTGFARSATLTIAGKSFTISQAAGSSACDPAAIASLSASSQSFGSAAASGSVTLNYTNGCAWSTTGVPSWVTITSGGSGQGSGTVYFSVAGNSGSARSATLTIAGKSFTINQGAAVVCSTTPIGQGITVNGNLAAATSCGVSARGAGYHVDRYSFSAIPGQQISIQLSSAAFDTYLYLRDPSGTIIASNDDGGGGTNSRIPASSGVFTLPAGTGGTYTIEVTSYYSAAGGAYTLLRN